MSSIAQVARETIVTYYRTRWFRSKLALISGVPVPDDPGFGRDEICPVIYTGQPFDPGNPRTVAAVSTYAIAELQGLSVSGTWVHGVGFITLNIAEIDVEQLDRGSRGSFLARDRVSWIIATPQRNGPKLADQYCGASAALFNGVDLRPNAAGIQRIWNNTEADSITQRPVQLDVDDEVWQWYAGSAMLSRLYRQQRMGRQEIVAA